MNRKNRKIIFLDIDGTLTEPGCNEVPESAAWAVRQARSQGHYVYLCTGRNYGMLAPLLKYRFDGIIGSAGGYIKCGEKVIYDCPMTEVQKQSVLDVLEKNGIYRTVECKDSAYVDDELKVFLRKDAAKTGSSELLRWQEQLEKNLCIFPMREYQGQPVYKVVIMSTSMEPLIQAHEVLQEDFDFCIQEKDPSGLIHGEVIHQAFDKGKAVERVCQHLNIPLSNTIAIGDSMNDLEMIQTAGLGICMQNGSEKLKKLADDVCPSVSENGIRAAFLKHHLIYEERLKACCG